MEAGQRVAMFLLAFKEEGGQNPKYMWSLESGKGKEMTYLLEPSEKTAAWTTP